MKTTHIPRFTHLVATLVALFVSSHALAQPRGTWTLQDRLSLDSGGTVHYRAISAPDSLHCIAVGFSGDFVLARRTTDGGQTWQTVISRFLHEANFNDIAFSTSRLGLIVGDSSIRDTGGTIFRTSDGGDTWERIPIDASLTGSIGRITLSLYRISMHDSVHGFISALGNLFFRTDDGGITWQRVSRPAKLSVNDVACLGPGHYIATTPTSAYRTVDGGEHWTNAELNDGAATQEGVWFVDSLNGYSAGNSATADSSRRRDIITRTTDGGQTWFKVLDTTVHQYRSQGLNAITFADAAHGIATGYDAKLFWTSDGGTTWAWDQTIDSLLFPIAITGVAFPTPTTAWIATNDGRILKWSASTANVPAAPTTPAHISELRVYPNPADGSSALNIELVAPRADHYELSLVDVRGESVSNLEFPYNAVVPHNEGEYHFTWLPSPALPSGIYFLRLICGSSVIVTPITIMR